MVEGARLESVCTCKRTEGSNPSLSAISKISKKINKNVTTQPIRAVFFCVVLAC